MEYPCSRSNQTAASMEQTANRKTSLTLLLLSHEISGSKCRL